MYIACDDTSVIVINFRKSKTHAITDTHCTDMLIMTSGAVSLQWCATANYNNAPLAIR